MKFNTRYIKSECHGLSFDPESSLCMGSFKDECDINMIIERYQTTGSLPVSRNPFQARHPQFGDFTNVTDYQSVLHTMEYTKNAFMELPATLRAKFDNDPSKLMAFLSDPSNDPEAVKIKLKQAKASTAEKPTTSASAPHAGEVVGTATNGAEK